MRSGNPVLGTDTFETIEVTTDPMTFGGTVNKTAILLALVFASALFAWGRATTAGLEAVIPLLLIGLVGGLGAALLTTFVKRLSPYTAPLYALLEGLVIGGLSALYEVGRPGIVLQAVGLTFGTLACLLVAYRSGLIRATEKFRLGVAAATGAIALLYFVDLVLMFMGRPIGFIHEGGLYGIIFSLIVVGVAALNLILDFDFIEQGVAQGSPKYMEWYGAFGLIVTLIWLYLEILRLLSKLRR